jgi:hypothetical protein
LDYNDYDSETETAPSPPATEEELAETKAYNEAAEELRKLEQSVKDDEGWLGREYGTGAWSGVEEGGCIEGTFGEWVDGAEPRHHLFRIDG